MSATSSPPPAPWRVVAGTALAYAVVGWLALTLAVPPGYASPLYPSAGIALAAVLTCGRWALLGTAFGSFLVNVMLSASRGQLQAAALLLPAAIGAGAALQAAVSAALVRRFVHQPLMLDMPRDIAAAGLLGAIVGCTVNPTIASLALRAADTIGPGQLAMTWGTWWVGDALGVLIGAPLALTLIGQPRDDWAPRRRSVGLPLLLATLLLAAATLAVRNWDEDRVALGFERDAEQMAAEAETRLRRPIDALQALNGAYLAAGTLTAPALRDAARWWLAQPLELQAVGWSPRIARRGLPAFEAAARADGLPGYRVFDREPIARADADVVAIRLIEPIAGNAAAYGVNAMSIPAARAAVQRTRDSGAPAASQGFRLTQASGDETGLVIYQALYDRAAAADRTAGFRGVVFVTVRAERLLRNLAAPGKDYLQWCLLDRDPTAALPRLAGNGCDASSSGGLFERRRTLSVAAREFELRVRAAPMLLPGRQLGNVWLFSVAGLAAAAMLGALLLTVTGRARRIELAVQERTAELRREVSERSHAEAALRDSEARLRSILDNVPIGIVFLDRDGRIVATNPRLGEMLGRDPEALLDTPLAAIVHPDEQPENRRQIDELLARRITVSRRQMRLLRGDGRTLWVRAHLALLDDAGSDTLQLAGAVENITDSCGWRNPSARSTVPKPPAARRANSSRG